MHRITSIASVFAFLAGGLGLTQQLPAAGDFVRGDADRNGQVEISVSIAIFGALFLGGAEPGCLDAADANDSGRVNIADGIFILNFLFRGERAPPAPYPIPGADPTNDLL